jgi:hypothetical protein
MLHRRTRNQPNVTSLVAPVVPLANNREERRFVTVKKAGSSGRTCSPLMRHTRRVVDSRTVLSRRRTIARALVGLPIAVASLAEMLLAVLEPDLSVFARTTLFLVGIVGGAVLLWPLTRRPEDPRWLRRWGLAYLIIGLGTPLWLFTGALPLTGCLPSGVLAIWAAAWGRNSSRAHATNPRKGLLPEVKKGGSTR